MHRYYLSGYNVRMTFHAYLAKHDTKVRPDGAELIRLSKACNRSAYYLYLTALGHKRVGPDTAKCIADNSIGGELTADDINVRGDLDNNNVRRKSVKSREVERAKRKKH